VKSIAVPGYGVLAAALRYPSRPSARAALLAFPGFAGQTRAGLEELYTRTFDVNPVCSLEIGWHLFGEDYNRGAFLVRARGLLRAHGIAEGTELPDHLESVLLLLDAMERAGGGEAGPFARRFVLPALRKMRAGFADGDNPYGAVLERIEEFLRARHGEPDEWSAPAAPAPYGCGGCHGAC